MLALSIHRVLFNDLNGDLPFSSAGDLFEDIEFIVIQGSILRIRYVDLFEVHKAGVIVEGNLAQTDGCNPDGAAGIGVHGIGHLVDLNVHYIGEELTPDM